MPEELKSQLENVASEALTEHELNEIAGGVGGSPIIPRGPGGGGG